MILNNLTGCIVVNTHVLLLHFALIFKIMKQENVYFHMYLYFQ